MRFAALFLFLPLLAQAAASTEEYQSYFRQKAQEDRSVYCAEETAKEYRSAYSVLAELARKNRASIVGNLTSTVKEGDCGYLATYYATLSNGMRCYYSSSGLTMKGQPNPYCR